MKLLLVCSLLLPVCVLPAQRLRNLDHTLYLDTPRPASGVIVVARPPFQTTRIAGQTLHFAIPDVQAVLPFTTDASHRWSLSYPKDLEVNAILQAVWREGPGIVVSNAVHLRRNVYRRWSNGPVDDPRAWPIGVWLQSPDNAGKYRDIGINLFVGLWQGPTAAQLSTLSSYGMPVFASQNALALTSKDAGMLQAWTHVDEPDNAQWNSTTNSYDPPILPSVIQARYQEMRAKDATRPVFLNFGPGMADEKWVGRGTRTGHLEDYPEYIRGADIVCFDIYPIADPTRIQVQGQLHYVGDGVRRLAGWAKEKPVFNFVEAAGINRAVRPTPSQLRAEVWMSIINGACGTFYFVHEFKPSFIEDTVLRDPVLRDAVTKINRRLSELAPVLNGESLRGEVEVAATTRIETLVKEHAGKLWVFAVNMEPAITTATFTVRGVGEADVRVLDESRQLPLRQGRFTDSFHYYDVRLYEIALRPE